MTTHVEVQRIIGQMQKTLECAICLELMTNPVSTTCGHRFCRFCLTEFLEKKRQVPCPLCKKPITKRSLMGRDELGAMVDGVRNLILAFQTDTGALFSPPRGPQSSLQTGSPDTLANKSTHRQSTRRRQPVLRSIQQTGSDVLCEERTKDAEPNSSSGLDMDEIPCVSNTELLMYIEQGNLAVGSKKQTHRNSQKHAKESEKLDKLVKDKHRERGRRSASKGVSEQGDSKSQILEKQKQININDFDSGLENVQETVKAVDVLNDSHLLNSAKDIVSDKIKTKNNLIHIKELVEEPIVKANGDASSHSGKLSTVSIVTELRNPGEELDSKNSSFSKRNDNSNGKMFDENVCMETEVNVNGEDINDDIVQDYNIAGTEHGGAVVLSGRSLDEESEQSSGPLFRTPLEPKDKHKNQKKKLEIKMIPKRSMRSRNPSELEPDGHELEADGVLAEASQDDEHKFNKGKDVQKTYCKKDTEKFTRGKRMTQKVSDWLKGLPGTVSGKAEVREVKVDSDKVAKKKDKGAHKLSKKQQKLKEEEELMGQKIKHLAEKVQARESDLMFGFDEFNGAETVTNDDKSKHLDDGDLEDKILLLDGEPASRTNASPEKGHPTEGHCDVADKAPVETAKEGIEVTNCANKSGGNEIIEEKIDVIPIKRRRIFKTKSSGAASTRSPQSLTESSAGTEDSKHDGSSIRTDGGNMKDEKSEIIKSGDVDKMVYEQAEEVKRSQNPMEPSENPMNVSDPYEFKSSQPTPRKSVKAKQKGRRVKDTMVKKNNGTKTKVKVTDNKLSSMKNMLNKVPEIITRWNKDSVPEKTILKKLDSTGKLVSSRNKEIVKATEDLKQAENFDLITCTQDAGDRIEQEQRKRVRFTEPAKGDFVQGGKVDIVEFRKGKEKFKQETRIEAINSNKTVDGVDTVVEFKNEEALCQPKEKVLNEGEEKVSDEPLEIGAEGPEMKQDGRSEDDRNDGDSDDLSEDYRFHDDSSGTDDLEIEATPDMFEAPNPALQPLQAGPVNLGAQSTNIAQTAVLESITGNVAWKLNSTESYDVSSPQNSIRNNSNKGKKMSKNKSSNVKQCISPDVKVVQETPLIHCVPNFSEGQFKPEDSECESPSVVMIKETPAIQSVPNFKINRKSTRTPEASEAETVESDLIKETPALFNVPKFNAISLKTKKTVKEEAENDNIVDRTGYGSINEFPKDNEAAVLALDKGPEDRSIGQDVFIEESEVVNEGVKDGLDSNNIDVELGKTDNAKTNNDDLIETELTQSPDLPDTIEINMKEPQQVAGDNIGTEADEDLVHSENPTDDTQESVSLIRTKPSPAKVETIESSPVKRLGKLERSKPFSAIVETIESSPVNLERSKPFPASVETGKPSSAKDETIQTSPTKMEDANSSLARHSSNIKVSCDENIVDTVAESKPNKLRKRAKKKRKCFMLSNEDASSALDQSGVIDLVSNDTESSLSSCAKYSSSIQSPKNKLDDVDDEMHTVNIGDDTEMNTVNIGDDTEMKTVNIGDDTDHESPVVKQIDIRDPISLESVHKSGESVNIIPCTDQQVMSPSDEKLGKTDKPRLRNRINRSNSNLALVSESLIRIENVEKGGESNTNSETCAESTFQIPEGSLDLTSLKSVENGNALGDDDDEIGDGAEASFDLKVADLDGEPELDLGTICESVDSEMSTLDPQVCEIEENVTEEINEVDACMQDKCENTSKGKRGRKRKGGSRGTNKHRKRQRNDSEKLVVDLDVNENNNNDKVSMGTEQDESVTVIPETEINTYDHSEGLMIDNETELMQSNVCTATSQESKGLDFEIENSTNNKKRKRRNSSFNKAIQSPCRDKVRHLSGMLVSPASSFVSGKVQASPDDIFLMDSEMPAVDASPMDMIDDPDQLLNAAPDGGDHLWSNANTSQEPSISIHPMPDDRTVASTVNSSTENKKHSKKKELKDKCLELNVKEKIENEEDNSTDDKETELLINETPVRVSGERKAKEQCALFNKTTQEITPRTFRRFVRRTSAGTPKELSSEYVDDTTSVTSQSLPKHIKKNNAYKRNKSSGQSVVSPGRQVSVTDDKVVIVNQIDQQESPVRRSLRSTSSPRGSLEVSRKYTKENTPVRNVLATSKYSPNPSKYNLNPSKYSPNPSKYSPNPSKYSPNPSKYSPNPSKYSPAWRKSNLKSTDEQIGVPKAVAEVVDVDCEHSEMVMDTDDCGLQTGTVEQGDRSAEGNTCSELVSSESSDIDCSLPDLDTLVTKGKKSGSKTSSKEKIDTGNLDEGNIEAAEGGQTELPGSKQKTFGNVDINTDFDPDENNEGLVEKMAVRETANRDANGENIKKAVGSVKELAEKTSGNCKYKDAVYDSSTSSEFHLDNSDDDDEDKDSPEKRALSVIQDYDRIKDKLEKALTNNATVDLTGSQHSSVTADKQSAHSSQLVILESDLEENDNDSEDLENEERGKADAMKKRGRSSDDDDDDTNDDIADKQEHKDSGRKTGMSKHMKNIDNNDGDRQSGDDDSDDEIRKTRTLRRVKRIDSDDDDDDDVDDERVDTCAGAEMSASDRDDSTLEDSDDDEDLRNMTSSSAFSSQSENLTTQERHALEQDLERLAREKRAIEKQLRQHKMQPTKPGGKEKVHTLDPDDPVIVDDDVDDKDDDDDIDCGVDCLEQDFSLAQLDHSLSSMETNEGVEAVPDSEPSQTVTRRALADIDHNKPSSTNADRPGPGRKVDRGFVTTGLNTTQMKKTTKLAAMNGAKFFTKFNQAVTHVIVKAVAEDERLCERTLKYFQGVVCKCWVVNYHWVTDSLQAGHLLPEADYEIQGDTSYGSKLQGPRRSRLSPHKLFTGHMVHLIGDNELLSKDSLADLVTLGGGKVTSDLDLLTQHERSRSLVVACADMDIEDDEDQQREITQKAQCIQKKYNLVTVTREWILDSVTMFKIQPLQEYTVISLGQSS